jgi:hypothetical protein
MLAYVRAGDAEQAALEMEKNLRILLAMGPRGLLLEQNQSSQSA